MGIFNLFFSAKNLPDELLKDDARLVKIWNEYRRTFDEKTTLVDSLTVDNLNARLQRIQQLLDTELTELEGETQTEQKIAAELLELSQEKRLNRLQRIDQALANYETRHKYLFELLSQLHQTLVSQLKLLATPTQDTKQLITHIQNELKIEREIIQRIDKFKTLHKMLPALLKGEEIIRRLDAKEQKLEQNMAARMRSVFTKQTTTGIINTWARAVFDAVEDEVAKDMKRNIENPGSGILEGDDDHRDIEYVNRPEFVDLVRAIAKKVSVPKVTNPTIPREKEKSDRMINLFVQIYREWYTYEINTKK